MTKKKKSAKVFFPDIPTQIDKEWQDMPEFKHKDLEPKFQLIVSFKNKEDRDKFAELIGQKITNKTQSLWYPKAKIKKYINKRYISKKHKDEKNSKSE